MFTELQVVNQTGVQARLPVQLLQQNDLVLVRKKNPVQKKTDDTEIRNYVIFVSHCRRSIKTSQ